jgi:hypothetical protein
MFYYSDLNLAKNFTCILTFVLKGIHGVNKFEDGCNPATWMLEVTSPEKEMELGIDFFEVYKDSELYRYLQCFIVNQTIDLENNPIEAI